MKATVLFAFVVCCVWVVRSDTWVAVGDPCTVNGDCGSGNCVCSTTCACQAVPVTSQCHASSDCTSSTCNFVGGVGTCIVGLVGATCVNGEDCSSYVCTSNLCAAQNVDTTPTDSVGRCHVNSDCTSSSCVNGQCAPVPHDPNWPDNQNQCAVALDCTSQNCATNAKGFFFCGQNSPMSPPVMPQCGANSDCTSNICDLTMGTALSTCLSAPTGSPCVVELDCLTGNCVPIGHGTCYRNSPSSDPNFALCYTNADCTSGICDLSLITLTGLCRGDLGSVCYVVADTTDPNPYCLTGNCDAGGSTNVGDPGVCSPSIGGDMTSGGPCFHNEDCVSLNCSTVNPPNVYTVHGFCQPAQVGARCEENSDCMSNNCGINSGVCTPNSANGDCSVNSDCFSQTCDCSMSPGVTCVTIANYGVCNKVGAGGACATSADCGTAMSTCDPVAFVCTALAVGTACTGNGDCVTNYCGAAGSCAKCTSGGQCGSGKCSLDGTCARSLVGGACSGASDCSTRLCGAACLVSSVGGFCESELDCTSGQCDRGHCVANSFNGLCFTDSDCVTGMCSSCDPRGTGDCTTLAGTCQAVSAGGRCALNSDCTSGVCTQGTCQVAALNGHCAVDGDCPTYLFCSPPSSARDCHDDDLEDIPYNHCDFNACFNTNGFCDAHATCTPLKCRRRECKCITGWFGKGNLLSPDLSLNPRHTNLPRELQPGCHTPCTATTCDVNAVCSATSSLITTCRCKDGYIGNGSPGTCVYDPCFPNEDGVVSVCPDVNSLCLVPSATDVTPTGPGLIPTAEYVCLCQPGYYTDYNDAGACVKKPRNACSVDNGVRFGGPILCQCGTGIFAGRFSNSYCAPVGVVSGTEAGKCQENSDCTTLKCSLTPQATARGVQKTCQVSQVGQPCFYNSDCTSGNCDSHFTLLCLPNARTGPCITDSDCSDGLFCETPVPDGNRHQDLTPRCALNKCADNNGGCDAVGLCTPLSDEVRVCKCPQGYFGSGYAYDPEIPGSGCVNLCAVDNGGCYVDPMASINNAFCFPLTYKSVECLCAPGLVGDGIGEWGCGADLCGVTTPYTQPGTGMGANAKLFNGCPVNSFCQTVTTHNSMAGYLTCVCEQTDYVYVEPPTGTQLGTCVINPCKTRNGGCPEFAACSLDITGRTQCACISGYSPQGTTFTPGTAFCASDPCATVGVDGLPNNGGCDVNANCLTVDEFTRRHGHRPAVSSNRVCTCNSPYLGDGIYCVTDPCLSDPNFCNAYAHTVCTAVFTPPSASSGPSDGTGAVATKTCPCQSGYHQANAFANAGFAACAPSCSSNNGNCDASSTTCSDVGNSVVCKCKLGYFYQPTLQDPPVFGATVAPGVACFAANCDFGAVSATLPANVNAGDCANVIGGQTCHLGCNPAFVAVSEPATRTQCVATSTGANFVLPKDLKKMCISATQSPTVKPAKTPRGSGWDCSSSGGVVSCAPKKPTVRKSWSEATHTGSATVSWKALGTSVPVTRFDVILSGETTDLVGVVQTPPNPQPEPTKSGSVSITGLHPGKRYSVTLVATVRTSADGVTPVETVQYSTEPYTITACSALC